LTKNFFVCELFEIIWIKILNTDGASIVWQKLNKKLFFYQKSLLTSVEDCTNALFVEMKLGYRVEGHQQKVFIEKNSDQKNFSKKIMRNCYHFG